MKEFIESVLYDQDCDIPQSLRSVLISMICKPNGIELLKKYFYDHHAEASKFRSCCRDHAFRFIETEIERLKNKKNQGIMSVDDEYYAKNELQSLLDSIESLCVRGVESIGGFNFEARNGEKNVNMSNFSPNGTGYRVYTDPKLPFSIHIPNGWLLDTSGQHNTTLLCFHPDTEKGFRANVNVTVSELAPLTEEEYITLSRLELKRLARLAKLPIDQTDSDNTHLFEWASNQQPIPLQARQRLVFAGPYVFVVTATSFQGTFEKHRPEFETILRSFALTLPGT